MRLFRKHELAVAAEPARPAFGSWLLTRFAGERELAALTFAELERAIANSGSVVIGAALGAPGTFPEPSAAAREEARLVARHTADGFKAALEDRKHTVICWPWEHLSTRLAWNATRAGRIDVAAIGADIEAIGAAYALLHREQLMSVIEVWDRVAAGVLGQDHPGASPDLRAMGATMLAAYQESLAMRAVATGAV